MGLIVSSLQRGGAERQVVALANHLDAERFDVHVITLAADVPLAADLAPHVPLHIVAKRWRFDATVVLRAVRLLRRLQLDVVHGFLFDAEMVARVAGRLARVPVIVASERNADYRRPLVQRVGQRLSRGCYDVLIANSHAGRRFAQRTLALPDERVRTVANGVDVARFAPGDRAAARRALAVPGKGPLVGMVASIKPQKNYEMFVAAAARITAALPGTQFVCVGATLGGDSGARRLWRSGAGLHGDTAAYRRMIERKVHAAGLNDAVHWRPHVNDMPSVYNACDVLVLTSDREGTPNCVLEAMACARPVVVTDVADNARIVDHGVTGFVVPRGDAATLAARTTELLRAPDRAAQCGAAGRERCLAQFTHDAMARRVAEVYREHLCARQGRRAEQPIEAGRRPAEARS